MQIVIDISETLKNIADEGDIKTFSHLMWQAILMEAIKSGVILPKGHGRLIDANELCEDRVSNDNVVIAAKCASTIIEADKAESKE